MRYITSLISGVGIFCTGTGLSLYHGIEGLLSHHSTQLDTSYHWAFFVLFGSLVSEGATLLMALNAAKKAAVVQVRGCIVIYFFQSINLNFSYQNISLREYILRGTDPTLNVVILEDLAAVLGVAIAGSCMALTILMKTPIFDACGSVMIGGLLGTVATFVIITNSEALVGRSIPSDRLDLINKCLESDPMVRAIHDVKATNMGNEVVRYKGENIFWIFIKKHKII